jgi:hypothetical protein
MPRALLTPTGKSNNREVIEYMAKLNGVTVSPAVAERIQYNGVEYVKTDAPAKAGDIVRVNDLVNDMRIGITGGGFYEVVNGPNGIYFDDDDGDERGFEPGAYPLKAVISALTVFTPATSAAAPAVSDPKHCDYVVLEPVDTKSPESERLKVGDYAKLTDDSRSVFAVNDIVKITEVDEDDDRILYRVEGVTSQGSDKSGWDWLRGDQVVRTTDAEVAEAIETAKWAAIGRNVGEYKPGDIVKVVSSPYLPHGTIGTVEETPYSWIGSYRTAVRTAVKNSIGGYLTDCTGDVELIAPVESLFTK